MRDAARLFLDRQMTRRGFVSRLTGAGVAAGAAAGISRTLAAQAAPSQPGAAQVAWFRDRVGSIGRRIRKVMVVALARKLLIALWRFVIDGVMPEGAVMKPSI